MWSFSPSARELGIDHRRVAESRGSRRAVQGAGLSAEEQSILRSGAAAVGATIDRDFERRLATHLDLLVRWGARLRLTGERDRTSILRKHVIDSLAVAPLLPSSGVVIDLGSGAGFPGLVIACLRLDLDVVLVESRRRKASFLGDVVRSVPLPKVQVVNARAESVAEQMAHAAMLVVSRGLRLDAFLPLAARMLVDGGRVVAMQTQKQAEAAEAVAAGYGVALERRIDYRLPDGAPRSLLAFRRRHPASASS